MRKGEKKTVIRPLRVTDDGDRLMRSKAAKLGVGYSKYMRMKLGVEPLTLVDLILYYKLEIDDKKSIVSFCDPHNRGLHNVLQSEKLQPISQN